MTDTTMLEKATTAVAACLTDAPVDPTFSMADVNGWTEEKSYEIVRAVLLAVREPDSLMEDAADMELHPSTNFRAMIDAILADGEEQ